MDDDDDYMYELKSIIFNDLNETEKRVMIMYAELYTFSAVGRELGISNTTARYQIMQIQEKIKKIYRRKKLEGLI